MVDTPMADYTPHYIDVSDSEMLVGESDSVRGSSIWRCHRGTLILSCVWKKGICVVTVTKEGAHIPLEDSCGKLGWYCSSENVPNFRAVVYYFAERFNQVLDIPVGMINCSWGSSRIRLPIEIVKDYRDVDLARDKFCNRQHFYARVPAIMYNGAVKSLINIRLRVFLCYQNEANVGDYTHYMLGGIRESVAKD